MEAGIVSFDGVEEADDSCCCGCCAKCNCCRTFQKVTMDEMLMQCTPGDLLLFENGCSLGTCCIGCWTRSEFDHVGVIYRGASVVSANCNGKEIQVCYDTPHLVEAMSPVCLAGPLKSVIKSVWNGGGQVYWRKVTRPLMEGESAQPDAPTIPAHIPAQHNVNSGAMIEVGRTDVFTERTSTDNWSYFTENLKQRLDENHRLPKEKRRIINIDVLNEEGIDILAAKIEDTETDKDGNYKLCEPLTYQEWNQSCNNLANTEYESNFMDMVNATITQDADCWDKVCGECFCERTVNSEGKSDDEKKESDKSLFCSELVALQFLRAGWRKGKDRSDKYLPKDFTDDPHETLSDDLSDGIEFSNMIQIVPTSTGNRPPLPVVRGRGLMRDVSDLRPRVRYSEVATAGETEKLIKHHT